MRKLGWCAAASAGVVLLALALPHLFGDSTHVGANGMQLALTMIALGVSLSAICMGWSPTHARARPDSLVLIRAFSGIVALSAAYLAFTCLSESGTGQAISGVLLSGVGLMSAAGMLAASYLSRAVATPTRQRRWIAAGPGFAFAVTLALAWVAALAAPAPPLLFAGIAGAVSFLLYGWAGARLVRDFRTGPADDLFFLLTAIAIAMPGEVLLAFADRQPEARLMLGSLCRIVAFTLTFLALFERSARATGIGPQRALPDGAAQIAAQIIKDTSLDLRNRIEQLTRQLAAANQELEALGYSISHDLRAPLRAIEGFSRLVASNYPDKLDDTGRDLLGRIERATVKMHRLIDDMLKLAQISIGDVRNSHVDISAMARAVLADLSSATLPPRSVVLRVDEGLSAEANPTLVKILLQNLLGNAWKFTGRTDAARIEVSAYAATDGTGFQVSDNGAGFDMKYSEKLFGAFQRLHRSDEFEGSGMGLAIVRRIVNLHGWSVQAHGEPGKGAVFRILTSVQ